MWLSSPLNASQEAGRLDNYRDPHPIEMSIKLFRAWHDAPPPTPPLFLNADLETEREQVKRGEERKKRGKARRSM